MLNVMRNLFSKPTRITVLGNPVRDAYLDVDAIAFPAQRVCFRRGDAQFDLAYQGDAIRFGEKRYAQSDAIAVITNTGTAEKCHQGVAESTFLHFR